MLGPEGEGARQLRLPRLGTLTGARVDQIEGDAPEQALRALDRCHRLGSAMLAPEEGERLVMQRLHAKRDAVDPGGAEIRKLARLVRGGIGFERDLGIGREAPQALCLPDQRTRQRGRHQRRRAPAEEDRAYAAAFRQRMLVRQVGQQRRLPRVGIHIIANMTVEVAIGALLQAEGPVDIKRKIVCGGHGANLGGAGRDGQRVSRTARRPALQRHPRGG